MKAIYCHLIFIALLSSSCKNSTNYREKSNTLDSTSAEIKFYPGDDQTTVYLHGRTNLPAKMELTCDHGFYFGKISYTGNSVVHTLVSIEDPETPFMRKIRLEEIDDSGTVFDDWYGAFKDDKFESMDKGFSFMIDSIKPFHYKPANKPDGTYWQEPSTDSRQFGRAVMIKKIGAERIIFNFSAIGCNSTVANVYDTLIANRHTYSNAGRETNEGCLITVYFSENSLIVKDDTSAHCFGLPYNILMGGIYRKASDSVFIIVPD